MNLQGAIVVRDLEAMAIRLDAVARETGLNAWQAGMLRYIAVIIERLSHMVRTTLEQHG